MIQQRVALLLVFISFFLSAQFSRRVFERLPQIVDEITYLFQARMLARGDLTIATPQPAQAYAQPFVVDLDGKRFGKYPPGWPGLLAIGVILGQPWVINAFLAALTIALTYRLAAELYNADAGLIAALLATFSPLALLLNASVMAHTAALFATTLFIYGYWRMARWRGGALRWGIVAGIGLGMLASIRPFTAVGVALPFLAWSAVRILYMLVAGREQAHRRITALAGLALAAALLASTFPLNNFATTGDPARNLYTLVWEYDRVGFGDEFGRNGHTLEKGLNNTRASLTRAAADLFGWQLSNFSPTLPIALSDPMQAWPIVGASWILLPFGLIISPQKRWVWLLLGVPLALIGIHVAYWFGVQRYPRYYFAALSAAATLSALPLAWLMQRTSRRLVYAFLAAVTAVSLAYYSIPRVEMIRDVTLSSQAQIDDVLQNQQAEGPVLVIASCSNACFGSYASFLALTSPYLDSKIVAARDDGLAGTREAIIARFPGRRVIDITVSE